ncbi:DNA gyrase subunit A [bacterium]|nr:DNA gyrase subunit A [candidate division CSSED10-310 bacterium]
MITEEQIVNINIEDEMKSSFLDYAMSVIVGRALPDVRDGLKPVHRRVLFAMSQMGLASNKAFRKSAKIVGEVMGNFHPHGDAAIYDTMVRMAQDFSMRYLVVEGQGNFGSVDGDPPAAMRYTEARMSRLAEELLKDIDLNTVDFVPNYDESLTEPVVLPSSVPNLVVNGSSGIAVGMATNIPPHNLGEVVDALIYMIQEPDCSLSDLLKIIPGPDFPTGAYIFGREGILQAYRSGRGRIVLRAKAMVEPMPKSDRERIIVHELPYQVNKAALVEKIAELVKDKKIEGISDLRDESDRDGTRIVIELKKNELSSVILNQLYKHTNMQVTFGVIMLALVDNQPRVLNLQEVLSLFLDHRREVVVRRTRFLLAKAQHRAHILVGLRRAIDHIDAIITLIRAAENTDVAKTQLMERFGFSDIQAQAILDMRLARLTGLEREKLNDEYRELLKEIAKLEAILGSQSLLMQTIHNELLEIRAKFADERRTEILEDSSDIDLEDLIAEEEMAVMVTHQGYIKRSPLSLYRAQRRSGQGSRAIRPKEGDFVEHMFVSSTHNYLLVFTTSGKVYGLKVYRIPESGRNSRGTPIANLLHLESDERVATVLAVASFEQEAALIMVTKDGTVKKTMLNEFQSCTRTCGLIALNIREGDELIGVCQVEHGMEVFIATHLGMAIRFSEADVRAMGRTAMGVRGVKLKSGDYVIGMVVTDPVATILAVTRYGYGKRTDLDKYRLQTRGGVGVKNIRITERNGPVVGILRVFDEDEVLLITDIGRIIRFVVNAESLRAIGRSTQGVKLQDTIEESQVVAIARFVEEE